MKNEYIVGLTFAGLATVVSLVCYQSVAEATVIDACYIETGRNGGHTLINNAWVAYSDEHFLSADNGVLAAGDGDSSNLYRGFVYFDILGHEQEVYGSSNILFSLTYTAKLGETSVLNLDYIGTNDSGVTTQALWSASNQGSFTGILNNDSSFGNYTIDVSSIGRASILDDRYMVFRLTPSHHHPEWVNKMYYFSSNLADTRLEFTSLPVSSPDPVPEPATMLLLGTGLAGLAGSRLRKKKA